MNRATGFLIVISLLIASRIGGGIRIMITSKIKRRDVWA
ncbi:MAG: hypothetical protein RLY20_988 [Verrucomicrobiota bacterium]|jgi:hypothetical protein